MKTINKGFDLLFDKKFKFFNAYTEEQKGNIEGVILMQFVRDDELKLLKQFVNRGYEIDTLNKFALITASYHGYYKMTQYLINKGVDITISNNKPLECSIKNGHKNVTKLLNYHLRKQKLKLIINKI